MIKTFTLGLIISIGSSAVWAQAQQQYSASELAVEASKGLLQGQQVINLMADLSRTQANEIKRLQDELARLRTENDKLKAATK